MMLTRAAAAALIAACLTSIAIAAAPQPLASGLKNPASVCYGAGGLLYVAETGQPNSDGDGRVMVIRDGQPQAFAEGLNDPAGMVYYRDALYVADRNKIVKVDGNGHATDFAAPADFPSPPQALRDLAVNVEHGIMLATDCGDPAGSGGAIYRIDVKEKKIDAVAGGEPTSALRGPRGIVFDGESFALVVDGAGDLIRVKLGDHSLQRIAVGISGADALIWDHFGRLFISAGEGGRMFAVPRPGEKPILIATGLGTATRGCLHADGNHLIVPDAKACTLSTVATKIPGWEVDESASPVELEVAFPNLQWEGWSNESESGKVAALRPIVLTHAGDGSNRVFVATQQGVIHVFDNNNDAATNTKVFLDIGDRVRYIEKQNEEGLLGLAFHPNFAKNGELFVFYTDVHATLTNVVSRFRLKRDSPNQVDPASEERLIEIRKPYWNHDGGAIVFGPDGCLYITHGDGGAGNDPHGNGQNLATLLGKVLRIDVDHKSPGKNYAIPADNPFVKQPGAAPEVWAYGLRNVWRMAFDRQTGQLWGGEVGQNRFEEIVLLNAGGNYGWSVRESTHPFGEQGVDARPDLIEPIWEYDHEIGKSITGGLVYRGQRIPDLNGAYLYADYVTTRLWALNYDAAKKRVVANRPIKSPGLAVMSFGEDEKGEAYVLSASPNGHGIHRLVKSNGK